MLRSCVRPLLESVLKIKHLKQVCDKIAFDIAKPRARLFIKLPSGSSHVGNLDPAACICEPLSSLQDAFVSASRCNNSSSSNNSSVCSDEQILAAHWSPEGHSGSSVTSKSLNSVARNNVARKHHAPAKVYTRPRFAPVHCFSVVTTPAAALSTLFFRPQNFSKSWRSFFKLSTFATTASCCATKHNKTLLSDGSSHNQHLVDNGGANQGPSTYMAALPGSAAYIDTTSTKVHSSNAGQGIQHGVEDAPETRMVAAMSTLERDIAFSTKYLTDLRTPALWYPKARSMQRTIIAHLGPTNSGKTHSALAALRAANDGVYCGPLRLLAHEVADRFVAGGLACNLVTGQEQRVLPGARHTSCTTEMANLDSHLQVAVLDEIQLLGDPSRGWAWTQALLGLPAAELHVCGDPVALPLIQQLTKDCGDELKVHMYKRLSPLVPLREALGKLHNVEAGDCIVAFSRKKVHMLRQRIQRRTGRLSCLVYGALPPKTRRQQAALFNRSSAATAAVPAKSSARTTPAAMPTTPLSSGFEQLCTAVSAALEPGLHSDILVASDAIGMGLNLNIRRVVFSTLTKFDGHETRQLTASEIKQIAGRAGRFSSAHPEGYVTCMDQKDMHVLRQALAAPSEPLKQACLLPRGEDLAAFANNNATLTFAQAMRRFANMAKLSPHYFYGEYDNQYRIALMLRSVAPKPQPHFATYKAAGRSDKVANGTLAMAEDGKLTMEELLLFCAAPADMKDDHAAVALLRFATDYASMRKNVSVASAMRHAPRAVPQDEMELKRMEELHTLLELYAWLASRLPNAFPEGPAVTELLTHCSGLIAAGLDALAGGAGQQSAAAAGKQDALAGLQPVPAAGFSCRGSAARVQQLEAGRGALGEPGVPTVQGLVRKQKRTAGMAMESAAKADMEDRDGPLWSSLPPDLRAAHGLERSSARTRRNGSKSSESNSGAGSKNSRRRASSTCSDGAPAAAMADRQTKQMGRHKRQAQALAAQLQAAASWEGIRLAGITPNSGVAGDRSRSVADALCSRGTRGQRGLFQK